MNGQRGVATRAVRKTVTVLAAHADIGDRELDPEAREQIAERWLERFDAVVSVYGGETHRRSSSELVAVFGVPLLREDDAVRAARAANDLHSGPSEFPDELRETWHVRFALRVGLATGQTITSPGTRADGRPAPDVATAAAELARLAEPGETLLDDATAERLGTAFRAERLSPDRVRLAAPDEEAPEQRETEFVGREWELRQLGSAFRRALDEPTSYLFTIFGTAGIGKSRLAREFTRGIAEEATVLSGRCLSYGEGITFWPIGEMLRQVDPGDPVRGAARAMSGEVDGAAVVDAVGAVIGSGGRAVAPAEPAWAIRRLIEALARARPLVLVFDDLQWAESTLLDLIEYSVEAARHVPVLFLCLTRPEFLEDRRSWGGGMVNATSLFLEPLSPRLSEQLHRPGSAGGRAAGRRRRLDHRRRRGQSSLPRAAARHGPVRTA